LNVYQRLKAAGNGFSAYEQSSTEVGVARSVVDIVKGKTDALLRWATRKFNILSNVVVKKIKGGRIMHTLSIADIASLEMGIEFMEFISNIDKDARAKAADIGATLTVKGRVSLDANNTVVLVALSEIAKWSLAKPRDDGTYKDVTAVFVHAGGTRTYEMKNAFIISFREWLEDEEGHFEIVLRQKKDYVDAENVTIA